MSRMADFGNALYTGEKSFDFVGRSKTWYVISAVVMAIAAAGFFVQGGLNLSLEFTGGTEFRVATGNAPADYESEAKDAVREVAGATASANVSTVGGSTVRVQTESLDSAESRQVTQELAQAFDVKTSQISSTFIGPSWGATVSQQALRALVVFLALTTLLMTLYYRNWKMAIASMVALAHDMVITVGIYTWSGFEVSPATMIGFLTVLGYSLYDTVVVFDHVKENTRAAFSNKRMTFAEAANLAVNQTLVRSINTTVIAVLPIMAVLVIGFAQLGPGTLVDLSLALFIGMSVGAISSVFIATPLLVDLRRKDDEVVALDRVAAKKAPRTPVRKKATAAQPATRSAPVGATVGAGSTSPLVDGATKGAAGRDVTATATGAVPGTGTGSTSGGTGASELASTGSDGSEHEQTVTGRKVHRYAQSGPRNQPKKTPRRRRGRG